MANSCKASGLLNGTNERMDGRVSHASFVYGRGVGAAFQLVDDVLDFEGACVVCGSFFCVVEATTI